MRQGFFITAGSAVIIGLLAVIFYVESATTPGEQIMRAYGCTLCHPKLFESPLQCIEEQYEQGTHIRPFLVQSLQKAHDFITADSAILIAEYALPRQQQALAKRKQNDAAQTLYLTKCAACHGTQGEGQDERYPPLRGSEWITATPSRLREILHQGIQGPITVQGKHWDAIMQPPGVAPGEETDSLIRYLRQHFAKP